MTTNAKRKEVTPVTKVHHGDIRFTKMHGIGNDYIYINCMESMPDRLPDLAREMSDRHMGVGGDGIVLICPSDVADFRMRMFNNDGSEARMCGNASRCIAKYVHDHGLTQNNPISLETLSGIKALSLNMNGDEVESVTVDMGEPSLDKSVIPVVAEEDRVVEKTAFRKPAVYMHIGKLHDSSRGGGNPVLFLLADIPDPYLHQAFHRRNTQGVVHDGGMRKIKLFVGLPQIIVGVQMQDSE